MHIRLGYMLSLIFFVQFFVLACQQNKKEISIIWKNKQAVGISIPKPLVDDIDSASQLLQTRLANNAASILGEYNTTGEEIVFEPIVPLSRGMEYELFFRNKIIGKINIPMADASGAATLVAVYPSADTVPENLLKIYLRFSASMREGEALKHIALLDSHNDTVPGVFLDLQPELWNKERTVLTVWLDPGRIKRDLIPNQQMGNPLQQGKQYTLAVSGKWKDVQGLPLQKAYSKNFFVGGRDSQSPQPGTWVLSLPAAETKESFKGDSNEPLDYFLLLETVSIVDEKENKVTGDIKVHENETGFEFLPAQPWKPGRYKLRIASYLEDLAGNNLQRLFDREISKQPEKKEEQFFVREFIIPGTK